jgi:hypothetical protein
MNICILGCRLRGSWQPGPQFARFPVGLFDMNFERLAEMESKPQLECAERVVVSRDELSETVKDISIWGVSNPELW